MAAGVSSRTIPRTVCRVLFFTGLFIPTDKNLSLRDGFRPAEGHKETAMKTKLWAQWIVALVAGVALCLSWTSAAAQTTTATLSGVVRDSSGAVVAQAKVTLKSMAKGTFRA